jgi:hypothetical protein
MTSTDNPIELALHNANTEPTEENRAAVLKQFAGSRLYIGVREPLAALVDEAGRLLQSVKVPMLTSNGPEGPALLAFTSEGELKKRSPQAYPLLLEGRTVRELIARDGLAGVVLNPAGSWVFLASADLATG